MMQLVQKSHKSEATRAAILDAALTAFGEKGYAESSMDEVAKAAGVSKGLAYYHFGGKEKLATAALDGALGGFLDEIRKARESSENARQAITQMANLLCDKLYTSKNAARFVLDALVKGDEEYAGCARGYVELFLKEIESTLRAGQSEKTFRRAMNPRFAAVSLFGSAAFASLCYLEESQSPHVSDGELASMLEDMIFAYCLER